MDEKLRQAIRLILNGQREAGKELLKEVLRANPYDEKAWMWLVETLDTPAARQRALEACLRYLPDCEMAQRGLAILRQNASSLPAPSSPLPPPPVVSIPSVRPAYVEPVRIAATAPRRNLLPLSAFMVIVVAVCMAAASLGVYVVLPRGPHGAAGSNQTLDPSGDPIQIEMRNANTFTIPDDGYEWTVTPKARYQVTARVLGKHNYSYDVTDMRAKLSPYDLALGWGAMSNPDVDQWITWSQRGRWYYYEWVGSSPYKGEDIGLHSANTHIIPANTNITAVLDKVQIDDIIYLEGYLVNVITKIDGTSWFVDTSLTRGDTGDGGCEQMYVTKIIWNEQEYR
jgi:hypothetical protein